METLGTRQNLLDPGFVCLAVSTVGRQVPSVDEAVLGIFDVKTSPALV